MRRGAGPIGHMAEAEARVTAFGWLGKCLFMSQGGEEDDDTHRKFETTDMREWTFAVPAVRPRASRSSGSRSSGARSARDESGEWDFARGAAHHRDALRVVQSLLRRQRPHAPRTQRHRALRRQNPNAPKENVGFHWNALCAMSWGPLAELYLRAKAAAGKGDVSLLQQFYQKRLGAAVARVRRGLQARDHRAAATSKGETWEDEAGVDARRAARRRAAAERTRPDPAAHPHGGLPDGSPVRRRPRRGSADGSSRLIWNERILTFTDIEAMQERFGIHPSLVFLDAGYATYDVYRECAERGWVALMGDQRATFYPHKGKSGKTVQRFYSPRRKVVLGRTRQSCSRPLLEQPQHQGHARPPAPQSGPGATARRGKCPTTSTTTISPRWKASSGSRKRASGCGSRSDRDRTTTSTARRCRSPPPPCSRSSDARRSATPPG